MAIRSTWTIRLTPAVVATHIVPAMDSVQIVQFEV